MFSLIFADTPNNSDNLYAMSAQFSKPHNILYIKEEGKCRRNDSDYGASVRARTHARSSKHDNNNNTMNMSNNNEFNQRQRNMDDGIVANIH